ncbi:GNAT family N-acetyltransferase [Halobacillus litoralis]|uniref:GNAT family N-acetyltransferase n=1 Tax=Halobacillus litoralis TaxID=45668 RepID=UPI001CD431F7|nr:GNAT family protein [Halobacillus litoralis]MCA0969229.1 GNAT family N-acetyltransferase [Halobacillus litoralis]
MKRNTWDKSQLKWREFKEEDWKSVHEYASQPIVCTYQPWGPNTIDDSKAFVDQVIKDREIDHRTRFAFAILYKEKVIGTGELNIDDAVNLAGVISYILHPGYWGKGLGTEVANRLLQYGFKEMGLHRICATCDPGNTGSARILTKVGMKKEGRMRENLYMKDGWRDSLLFSVLEHEWTDPF